MTSQRNLTLEIPGAALFAAIAEEASIRDVDLDELERRVLAPELEAGAVAALALTIGRAGRASSRGALELAERRLRAQGHSTEADGVSIGLALLSPRPPPWVERAELGYRTASGDEELLIEDPIAAHWHARRRWGPPLRPDPEARIHLARGTGRVEALDAAIREGEIVLVYFEAGRFEQPSPPLFLTAAGFSRDVALTRMVRWSELRSVGLLERGRRVHAAFERRQAPVEALPWRSSVPAADLAALLRLALARARPEPAGER